MREIVLLRHAHAESPTAGQTDADRPLSAEGQAAAEAVGRWLVENGHVPDCVLLSPARRVRETAEAVLRVTGYVDQREEPEIYEATPGTLMEVADRYRECGRVMIVGHNPGLEQLAALLESGQSGDYRGMPPAGVAVLSLPATALLEPGVATLTNFWWP
ncbi:SixA phosphatase family protein [Cognatilysobacter lacus]|uniref:Histidine phosphatase family protein n=1 Tax=Cognatilysobacter lacus TaxID=1643323 RepID=A0A5D8Z0E4_9GAMM|nr:histidine phosphatase family protein [Lysobacter lacus]TZF88147.1 histidine phosphatase family protein [Lysobacter lacus]